jgi:hypothetical protein
VSLSNTIIVAHQDISSQPGQSNAIISNLLVLNFLTW